MSDHSYIFGAIDLNMQIFVEDRLEYTSAF